MNKHKKILGASQVVDTVERIGSDDYHVRRVTHPDGTGEVRFRRVSADASPSLELAPKPDLRASVTRLYPELLNYARRLTGAKHDSAEAEDLVQNAICNALQGWNTWVPDRAALSPAHAVRSWMYSIIHHGFIDGVRSQKRWRKLIACSFDEGPATGYERAIATDICPDPRVSQDAQSADEILDAVACLDPHHKEVIQMYYGVNPGDEGTSVVEIAQQLGIPRKTAATRLHRARRALENRLKEYATKTGYVSGRTRKSPVQPAKDLCSNTHSVERIMGGRDGLDFSGRESTTQQSPAW